mmetsp:Transcript_50901/g.85069  ORF Transcript_50901/g.85069 Transcript_50901/m.85069 type:complete len:97 (-) Transcript_50901:276-566(-)
MWCLMLRRRASAATHNVLQLRVGKLDVEAAGNRTQNNAIQGPLQYFTEMAGIRPLEGVTKVLGDLQMEDGPSLAFGLANEVVLPNVSLSVAFASRS